MDDEGRILVETHEKGENPDTIVSAEFLFTLASHLDSERRAIEYLFDDSYESEALNAINDEMTLYDDAQKAYPRIDRILSWSANRGIKERLKRLIQLGKWKSRGKT